MARKRIKSLAKEWGVPLEDVIASTERLKLAHAHTDASLLGPEEAERVKADLDEQAHRNAMLRKETVVETSAGTIVEKRLNATVMRRRHAETAPAPAGEAAQPFQFESQEAAQEETFVSPFMSESPQPQIDTPVFQPVIEPAIEAPLPPTPPPAALVTAPEVSAPATIQETPIEATAAEINAAPHHAEPVPLPTEAPSESSVEMSAKAAESVSSGNAAGASAQREPEQPAAAASARPAEAPRTETPREPSRQMPPAPLHDRRDFRRPEVTSRPRVETRPPQVAPSSVNGERRTLNLTKTGSHPAAPSLDDGQRGPKVLGKIDLRAKVAPPKPAAPTGRTMGPGGRPGQPAGRPQAGAPQPQEPNGPPPEPSNKPGAAGRALKKK